MNPVQQAIQLEAINRLLEGSGAIVAIQLPTEAQKTPGRPKGATNKSKTTRRDPSAFKHVEQKTKEDEKKLQKKRKNNEKQSVNAKKQKLKYLRAAEKAFQKAKQKDEEANEKGTLHPKRRTLPARNARNKAPLKDDDGEAKQKADKGNTPLPEDEGLSDKKAEPAPKKKIRPVKTATLPPKENTTDEPEPYEDNDRIGSLPVIIQSSVTRVLSPASDGHCGFCAIAWALGKGQGDYMHVRQELINELTTWREWYVQHNHFHNIDKVIAHIQVSSPAPVAEHKWMSMPATGAIMANAFKTPVFFFSNLLPLFLSPHLLCSSH
jgi:hypothetical protein